MNKLDLDINSAFHIYWNDGGFHYGQGRSVVVSVAAPAVGLFC